VKRLLTFYSTISGEAEDDDNHLSMRYAVIITGVSAWAQIGLSLDSYA